MSLTLTDAISREDAKGVLRLVSGDCRLAGAECSDLNAAQLEKDKKKEIETTIALINDSLMMVNNPESGLLILTRSAAATPASP
jgi:hypothetical protein